MCKNECTYNYINIYPSFSLEIVVKSFLGVPGKCLLFLICYIMPSQAATCDNYAAYYFEYSLWCVCVWGGGIKSLN